jgi:tetratricopeptide (TPR) repeat protein
MLKHAVLISVALSTSATLAAGLAENAIPGKWLKEYQPESGPALSFPAYYKDLDKAKLQAFSGRYKAALYTLAKVPEQSIDAALIRAQCLHALGKGDKALALLDDAKFKSDSRALFARAEILHDLGQSADAIATLRELLKATPNSIAGQFMLGHILEETGEIEEARQVYGWFDAEPRRFLEKVKTGGQLPVEDAAELTYVGRALDRLATFTGAYQDNDELHSAMLNLFVRAYDVLDRSYWPAHVAAAEYCLSHNDTKKAADELMSAMKANPNDAHVTDLLGKIAIASFNFDAADAAVDQIRCVNTKSFRAELLEARNLLQQRLPKEAEIILGRALNRQPKNVEAMSLLASSAALQLKDGRMHELLKQIDENDPGNASAYYEVAEQLGAMRQYPRAAEMYKIAIERAPWWTAARNQLGLLYTQSGDEDAARATLDVAHAMDPFNLETTNYLRLLDDLAKFAKKETEHFVVFYDAQRDPMIPEYFADYLEAIHADVCKAFNHEPSVKTYIEVFPTHDAFSVRTTGSPWIGTVGASTGRVIALVSPRNGAATMGNFNWAAVLRHEYTHTVTLSATDNRIAHWLTEGLAVWQEEAPLRWEWVPMLYNAVKNDELFTLDNITWGFVRPKKPMDRQMAYAQSYWICKYIVDTFGRDAMLQMLELFRNGQSQDEVFMRVLHKSTSQFDTEFKAWTQQQIATWGYDEETSAKYDDLRDLAEKYTKNKQYDQALEAWQEVQKIRPMDELPHKRLAGIYLTKQVNQPEKAIEHLKTLAAMESKDNRWAKRVARIYRESGKFADAAKSALLAVYTDPYDLDAHKLLAELYEKTGDAKGLKRETRVIGELEKWAEENRKAASSN